MSSSARKPRIASRRRREQGVVAVEFALVLPILIMLVFGVATLGLTYSDHLAITNSGSTLSSNQICVQLLASDGTVKASPTAQGSTCGNPPATPSSVAIGTCIVKVWVAKPRAISLVVFPDLTLHIGAQSVDYYGRAEGACPAS